MAENLYQPEASGGLFSSLILPMGAVGADTGANRLLGGRALGQRWWSPIRRFHEGNRARRSLIRGQSRRAWATFMDTPGWDPSHKFQAARVGVRRFMRSEKAQQNIATILRHTPTPDITKSGQGWFARTRAGLMADTSATTTSRVGKRVFARTVERAGVLRTAAALAKPLTGFASAYFTWAWALPLAAEVGVGTFTALARRGEQWRKGTPETSVGMLDMATRQQAFTMRQSSLMAIHMSQSGARMALGEEASILHGE